MRFLTDNGIKYRKMLFFLKNILWIEKNVVPLHDELRAYDLVAMKMRFLLINL